MAKARGLGKSIFDTFDDNLVESKKGAGEMLKISSVDISACQRLDHFLL